MKKITPLVFFMLSFCFMCAQSGIRTGLLDHATGSYGIGEAVGLFNTTTKPTIINSTYDMPIVFQIKGVPLLEITSTGINSFPSEAFMSVMGGSTSFVTAMPERIDGDNPGVTTSVTSSSDMSVAESRITYTGVGDKLFHVIGAISSATASASEMTYFVAVNGVTIGTGKRRDHSNSDTGYVGVQWVLSLSTNDYVEIYVDAVANETTNISTYNLTVKEW